MLDFFHQLSHKKRMQLYRAQRRSKHLKISTCSQLKELFWFTEKLEACWILQIGTQTVRFSTPKFSPNSPARKRCMSTPEAPSSSLFGVQLFRGTKTLPCTKHVRHAPDLHQIQKPVLVQLTNTSFCVLCRPGLQTWKFTKATKYLLGGVSLLFSTRNRS